MQSPTPTEALKQSLAKVFLKNLMSKLPETFLLVTQQRKLSFLTPTGLPDEAVTSFMGNAQ